MATKTSYALEITFTNDQMGETILKLDNALKNSGTLTQVRQAFAPLIGNTTDPSAIAPASGSILLDKNLRPIIFIPKVERIVVQTTRTTLE